MSAAGAITGEGGQAMFRPIEPSDYDRPIGRVDGWWGGRDVHGKLPRLFFEHFRDTSFVAEQDGEIIGFLVGLLAQSEPDEAYIHFVGVDTGHRRAGLARAMYQRFFDLARARGREVVRCITAPVNRGSIAYHTAVGVEIEPGDGVVNGIPVHLDHDGPGEHRVRFVCRI
jgi:ribosomal protein S18 acetylase RimI-like enzyme